MEEHIGSEAIDLVRGGATLMRIENETMMSAAVQRPRNEGEILKSAMRELDLVPELASVAYYSIPFRDQQPDGSVRITKVEGPSIKAAMSLARRWGNCTTGCRVMSEDEYTVELEGVFIDLETNFRIARPQRVSKTFRKKNKEVIVLSEDRLTMRVQAGASKAIRNAILAGLPAYLVTSYDKRARQIVGGNPDEVASKKTIDAVLSSFAKLNVSELHLERYSGKPSGEWTGLEIAELRGLWNAISDGQATVAEVFGVESGERESLMPQSKAQTETKDEPPPPPAQQDEPRKVDAPLPEPEKKSEPKPEPKPEPKSRIIAQKTGKVDRAILFSALKDKAKASGTNAVELLQTLTGKSSLASLSDDDCAKLFEQVR